MLAEDVGLLARVPNPLNSSRTLTICNGIHSRGVYGAVRSLTDAQLRDANERYIAANFGQSDSFAILMSVQVIKNKAMTPDFSSDGVVLYQWPQEKAACTTTDRGAASHKEGERGVRQLDTHRRLVSRTEQREDRHQADSGRNRRACVARPRNLDSAITLARAAVAR